jgi:hypothetical protein
MLYSLTEIAQASGVFAGAAGAVVYALKKNGKVTFGKVKERRNCAAAPCNELVVLVKDVRVNTLALEKFGRKLDSVAKDLNTAVGFIKAKTGGKL